MVNVNVNSQHEIEVMGNGTSARAPQLKQSVTVKPALPDFYFSIGDFLEHLMGC